MDWDKEPKKHPAYGHAMFSRTTGRIKLFASPLDYHNEFIVLRISRSEFRHDLSRDWRFAGDPLIEVAFSAAQFAQLLTTMNVGEGAPCTIQSIDMESMPLIPEEEDTEAGRVRDGFRDGLKEFVDKIVAYQKGVEEVLEKKTVGKKDRETIRTSLSQVRQEVEANWPFVVEQFERAALRVETATKAEIEAMITSAVEKLGLQSLSDLTKMVGGQERKKLS